MQKVGLLWKLCPMGSFYLNLAAAAAAGGWAGWLRLTGNIHEIAPGIYRAGQLGAARLTSFVREHGIKTVINLHEGNPVSAWYAAELAATAETGGHDVSLSLSANHQPGPASLTGLVATLRTAQAPLLIHWNGGADRSALACLWKETDSRRSALGRAASMTLPRSQVGLQPS